MPKEFVNYGLGWQDLHPDWHVKLWDPESLPLLINEPLFQSASDLMPQNVGQFCADIARLELLYRYGGVWVDTDLEALKPIDELLEGVTLFAAWERQDVWIGNTIIGCEPQNPFIHRALAGLAESVRANPDKPPNVVSGPQYLTKLYREDPPEDMTLFDEKLFFPYSYSELHREGEDFPDAYTVHRWNHRRSARRA